jgi:hypothetical protein
MPRIAAIVCLIGALTVALGANQITSTDVGRYGSVGITDAEVAQISNLVAGKSAG